MFRRAAYSAACTAHIACDAERWQDCRTRYDYVFCDTAQCSRMCAAAGCTLKLDLDRAALTDFKHRTVDTRAVSMHVTIEVASWTRCAYSDARWTIGIGCAVAAPCTRHKPIGIAGGVLFCFPKLRSLGTIARSVPAARKKACIHQKRACMAAPTAARSLSALRGGYSHSVCRNDARALAIVCRGWLTHDCIDRCSALCGASAVSSVYKANSA